MGNIRCNNCEKEFEGEQDLIKVVATSYNDGIVEYRKYDNRLLINTDKRYEEIIDACPNCMTDSFLMDTCTEKEVI